MVKGLSTWLMPIGLLLAFILGFWPNEILTIAIAIIGLVIGALNFQKAETQKGLLWVIALGVTSFATGMLVQLGMIASWVEPILLNVATFFGFAAISMVLIAGFRILKK